MNFAVIGGDMRQAKLAELLAADGHKVSVYAQDKLIPAEEVSFKESAQEALKDAECVVLPLPMTTKDGMLNTPLSNKRHTVTEVLGVIYEGQIVCAGRIDEETYTKARDKKIVLIDYFAREELAVSNAAATAEGAVQIMMEEMPITICGSKCLVLGFGRIGKMLAHKLHALGARVTVSARKYSDRSWIEALGYTAENTAEIDGRLSGYDAIINTVPARVLDERRLKEVDSGCLCLDLASKPGGMDFGAASRLGVKAVWALSLPGEVAPVTSGKIIKDTIYNILRERGMA